MKQWIADFSNSNVGQSNDVKLGDVAFFLKGIKRKGERERNREKKGMFPRGRHGEEQGGKLRLLTAVNVHW